MSDRGRFSCAAALAALPEHERATADRALAALGAELRGCGFELRDDSKLAFLHATGKTPMRRADVVQEMATIQWLSATTDYQRLCETALRYCANHVKEHYKIRDWATVWRIVRKYGPDLVKYHCIEEAHGFAVTKRQWADLAEEDEEGEPMDVEVAAS